MILIALRDYPCLQIPLLLVPSVAFQGLLLAYQPIDGASDNAIAVVNEFAVSLYLYLMLCLTEFTGDASLRTELGNAMLYLIMLTVGLNFLKAAAGDLIAIYPAFTRAFHRVLSHLKKKPK
jgi:hypothetical protein